MWDDLRGWSYWACSRLDENREVTRGRWGRWGICPFPPPHVSPAAALEEVCVAQDGTAGPHARTFPLHQPRTGLQGWRARAAMGW